MEQQQVNVTINGKKIQAPNALTVIQAVWHAGGTQVEGVGCLEGVCGSCRVMVKRANSPTVETQLGCQTLIEDGMQVIFLGFPSPTHHRYQLSDIQNSWESYAYFHHIFPEAKHCRMCHGCNVSCPKGIDVEQVVYLATKGRFRQAGKLFVECVMCNLCMTACPENIAPNHVGLFCRRVIPYFYLRPSNLISRLEEIRQGKHTINLD